MRLFFEVECREEGTMQLLHNNMIDPFQMQLDHYYEEVELTHKKFTLNFSQNVAYQSSIHMVANINLKTFISYKKIKLNIYLCRDHIT